MAWLLRKEGRGWRRWLKGEHLRAVGMEDLVETLHAEVIAMRDHAHRCWERALDLGPQGSGYAELLSTAELYYTKADEMQAGLGCQSPP